MRQPVSTAAQGAFDRREFLKLAGLTGVGLGFGCRCSGAGGARKPRWPASRPLGLYCANTPKTCMPYYRGVEAPPPVAATEKAVFDLKRCWDIGHKLTVRMLNPLVAPRLDTFYDWIATIAPIWCDYANIKIVFVEGKSDVTINCLPFDGPSGSVSVGTFNSYVGNDALTNQEKTPTMNLVFDPAVHLLLSDNDVGQYYQGLILHEFGHAIGLLHEHQRPDGPIEWNKPELYAYASKTWGWGQAMVDEQIIKTFDKIIEDFKVEQTSGTAFDRLSIMEYAFPAGLAVYKSGDSKGDPFEAPDNTELTPLDKVAAISVYYPDREQSVEDKKLELNKKQPTSGSIKQAGHFAIYSFRTAAKGVYALDLAGPMPGLLALLRKERVELTQGLPANILAAVETDGTAPVSLTATLEKETTYHVEVRHALPLQEPKGDKNSFTIRVRNVG